MLLAELSYLADETPVTETFIIRSDFALTCHNWRKALFVGIGGSGKCRASRQVRREAGKTRSSEDSEDLLHPGKDVLGNTAPIAAIDNDHGLWIVLLGAPVACTDCPDAVTNADSIFKVWI